MAKTEIDVIFGRCGTVFIHQLLNDFARIVEFVEVILEHRQPTEILHESFTFDQFVVVLTHSVEQLQLAMSETFVCNSRHLTDEMPV